VSSFATPSIYSNQRQHTLHTYLCVAHLVVLRLGHELQLYQARLPGRQLLLLGDDRHRAAAALHEEGVLVRERPGRNHLRQVVVGVDGGLDEEDGHHAQQDVRVGRRLGAGQVDADGGVIQARLELGEAPVLREGAEAAAAGGVVEGVAHLDQGAFVRLHGVARRMDEVQLARHVVDVDAAVAVLFLDKSFAQHCGVLTYSISAKRCDKRFWSVCEGSSRMSH
jgi:hypothetical protein